MVHRAVPFTKQSGAAVTCATLAPCALQRHFLRCYLRYFLQYSTLRGPGLAFVHFLPCFTLARSLAGIIIPSFVTADTDVVNVASRENEEAQAFLDGRSFLFCFNKKLSTFGGLWALHSPSSGTRIQATPHSRQSMGVGGRRYDASLAVLGSLTHHPLSYPCVLSVRASPFPLALSCR